MSPDAVAEVRSVLSESPSLTWVSVTESAHRLYLPAAFPSIEHQIACEARLSAHMQRHGLAVLHVQPQTGEMVLMLDPLTSPLSTGLLDAIARNQAASR